MPTFTVKNIPPELHNQIKQSASLNHRSMNNEIIFQLRKVLCAKKIDPQTMLVKIRKLHADMQSIPITDDIIRQAREEGRP